MADFRMPSLGADMESGTLTEWFVEPGDRVERGQIVASVETAKGIIDIEIFDSGVVEELAVAPGTEVEVGGLLATYRSASGAGEATPAAAGPTPLPKSPSAPTGGAPTLEAPPAAESATAGAATGAGAARPPISPAARRRAGELGVDVAALAGTGPGDAITMADVERASASARGAAPLETPAPGKASAPRAPAEKTPAGDMRAIIAQSMSRSKREIPHYYLATTIDMSAALAWLAEWNAGHPVTERLLYAALLVKAIALALEHTPELNGFWRGGRFEPSAGVHVGVAVRLRGGGLVAPALADANRAPLPELMRRLQGLVQRARGGRLRRTELTDATITVSSLGEGSVETVYPIIYPPQVAIVGVGAIVERPWCVGGRVAAAPVLTVTLAADHRVSDGHGGSLFLVDVARRLQQPEELV